MRPTRIGYKKMRRVYMYWICLILFCVCPYSLAIATVTQTMTQTSGTATLQADTDIPELGVSRGEYYDIVVYDGGETVVFQNLTNSFTAIKQGGAGHLYVRESAYSTTFRINGKWVKTIKFWRTSSNQVPDVPTKVLIMWDNGVYCSFQ